MKKFWQIFGIHAEFKKKWIVILSLLPFILTIAVYLYAAHTRNITNPDEKITPTIHKMVEAVKDVIIAVDKRTETRPIVIDTIASLKRICAAVPLSAIMALTIGLMVGLFPFLNALSASFLTFISVLQPLAILPILFIVFGVDELGKIALIFIGTFPFMARDIYLTVQKFPREQIIKAETLGASQLALAFRIVLPQIMPRLFNNVRLALGSAWIFVITAEAIASTEGLGYRIFLVRRYLAMDVIIPYVLWITLLGFTMDFILKKFIARRYAWYLANNQ